MERQDHLPTLPLPGAERALVVEAPRGSARDAHLARWVEDARASGATAWRFTGDFDARGVWTGLNTWLEDLLPRMEREAPALLARHADELAIVLPERGAAVSRRLTLTDTAPAAEAVRNYALDRAYRIGQGVVELMADWHAASGAGDWVVVVVDFERCGALGTHFFRELLRRRGQAMRLTLVAVVEPGAGERVAAGFDAAGGARVVRLDVPADPPAPVDREDAARRAAELDRRLLPDPLQSEVRFPEAIALWLAAGRPQSAAHWQMFALGILNHNGFYQDAERYVEPVVRHLDALVAGQDRYSRWDIVGNVFGTLIATGQVDRAQALLQDVALPKIDNAADRVRLLYVLAMVHSRFQPRPDLARGEACIHQAREEMRNAEMPDEDRHFMHVFLDNGLAFIRHRQGRPAEAAELTTSGFRELDENLPPDKHRLHRSVLLYNTAQVYAAMGRHEQALESYSGAMEMDPYYSEYYNERGNSYLALGRFAEAVRDYRTAIEYSSPYPEVWINLGQCLRAMGHAAEAVDAYSHALDLDPRRTLARVGRAQMLEALGRTPEALADYDALLVADPAQPLWLANRAVLHYVSGHLEPALADLNAAIALQPAMADLYSNRSVALADLGRLEASAVDLETYLALAPDAEDREEAQARLGMLRGALEAAGV